MKYKGSFSMMRAPFAGILTHTTTTITITFVCTG